MLFTYYKNNHNHNVKLNEYKIKLLYIIIVINNDINTYTVNVILYYYLSFLF